MKKVTLQSLIISINAIDKVGRWVYNIDRGVVMKKALSLLLIITIICSCFIPSFAANAVTLSLSADKTSANVGDIITVYVKISKDSALSSLDFYLNYDSSAFTYVSGSATASSHFVASVNDGVSGKVKFSGASIDVVNSAGTILTAKFKVTKVGGSLSVSVNVAADGDNNKITSSVVTKGLLTSCAHGGASWIETKAPTCITNGEKTATCSTCGKTLKELIPSVAHVFGEWVTVTPATETEVGLKEHFCTVCGKIESAEIPLVEAIETTTVESTTEATTKALENDSKNIDNDYEDSKTIQIVCGVVSFVAGALVGVGIMFVIFSKKKKEKQ